MREEISRPLRACLSMPPSSRGFPFEWFNFAPNKIFDWSFLIPKNPSSFSKTGKVEKPYMRPSILYIYIASNIHDVSKRKRPRIPKKGARRGLIMGALLTAENKISFFSFLFLIKGLVSRLKMGR